MPIAHRGLHDNNVLVPENSLPAFELAKKGGFTIELDVHLLADGNIVVFHDDTLERLCSVDGQITSYERAGISSLQLAGTSEKIPLLKDVLDLVAGSVPILIEIKNSSKTGVLEPLLYKVLSGYKGQIAIQSFNPFILAWYAVNAGHIPRGQLASDFKDEHMPWLLKQFLKRFLFNWRSQPDFIAYKVDDLPNARVANQQRKNRPLIGWTVRSQKQSDQLKGLCDNIIFEGFIPI